MTSNKFPNSFRHGTLRSAGGPGGTVRPVGDGREERSRMQLGALSPDTTPLDLYYNSRPPSDHSTWRLVFKLKDRLEFDANFVSV